MSRLRPDSEFRLIGSRRLDSFVSVPPFGLACGSVGGQPNSLSSLGHQISSVRSDAQAHRGDRFRRDPGRALVELGSRIPGSKGLFDEILLVLRPLENQGLIKWQVATTERVMLNIDPISILDEA